jgi:ABC-type amino acid transport substrate-binding protein
MKKINAADDVKGYVIRQFAKANHSKFVKDNFNIFKFDIISGGKNLFEQNLKKLIFGRIDAIHTLDEFTLLYEARRLKLDPYVKILFLPEAPLPFYSVFSKNEKGKMLKEKFDAAMEEAGFKSEDYIELVRHEFELLNKR